MIQSIDGCLFLFLLEELFSLHINARLKAQEPNEHVATQHERRTWESEPGGALFTSVDVFLPFSREKRASPRPPPASPVSNVSYQLSIAAFSAHSLSPLLSSLCHGEREKKKHKKSKLTHHPLVKLFNSPEPWDGGEMRQGAGAHFPKSLHLFMPQIGRNRTPSALISLWEEPSRSWRWGWWGEGWELHVSRCLICDSWPKQDLHWLTEPA